MKRFIGLTVVYSLFGTLTYFLFLYWTFPSEEARNRLVYEAYQGGIQMQVADVKPWLPMGLTLSGVDIYGPVDKRKARKKKLRPKPPPDPFAMVQDGTPGESSSESQEPTPAPVVEYPVLSFETLSTASLLPFLPVGGAAFGDMEVNAELYGGEMTLRYGKDQDLSKIKLVLSELDLARYPFKGESFDLQVSGTLGLDADLKVNARKTRESSGTVVLDLDRLVIQKTSKIQGFQLPTGLAFNVSGGDMEVENGRLELEELKLESTPLTVLVTGSISIASDLMKSRFNLKVALKFGDELQFMSIVLPKTARSDDDFYHYVISGPLSNLRQRPDRMSARKSGRDKKVRAGIGRRTSRNNDQDARPSFVRGGGIERPRRPILDEEERGRLREERRKRAEERRKRREELRNRRLERMKNMPRPPRPGRPMASMDDDEELSGGSIRPEQFEDERLQEEVFPMELEGDMPMDGMDLAPVPGAWDGTME